jgi:hypothetical protein
MKRQRRLSDGYLFAGFRAPAAVHGVLNGVRPLRSDADGGRCPLSRGDSPVAAAAPDLGRRIGPLKTASIDRVTVHPMVTVLTMFHGRVAVLPVVAIVAAIQEGQIGFNFQQMLLRGSKSSYICNSGTRFGRAAPPSEQLRSLNLNFNQAVARGELSNGLVEAGSDSPKRFPSLEPSAWLGARYL